MTLQEAQAWQSSGLLLFLLEDLLVDLLRFFSGLFPMVDNKTSELVQWWLDVWKEY